MIRRLLEMSLGLGASVLLWKVRIPQVATFLCAAELRRWFRSSKSYGPAARASDWSSVERPKLSNLALKPNAMITYHPEYHHFDPRLAISSLSACVQLRVEWLRTDVRWNELIPDGVHCDSQALAWYREFLGTATGCGLRNMVVLSSPPAAVLGQKGAGRLEAWRRFVRLVASELGTFCGGYQLMNEPNGPIYGFLSFEDCAQAIVEGASIIHVADPEATVAINISMEIWGWRQYLSDLLHSSGPAIDLIGLDHYPGTWTIGRSERWVAIESISNMIAAAEPGSSWFGRRLAIMETGYSTNTFLRDDGEQSRYFRNIQEFIAQLDSRRTRKLTLCGIYELCDGDSKAGLDPEAHFGIMTSDLRPKSAFATVAELVEML
jgi:hypothetical protein